MATLHHVFEVAVYGRVELTAKFEEDKCAHPSCSCPAAEGTRYCSAYCEAARDTTEIGCNCGHTGCELSVSRAGLGRAE